MSIKDAFTEIINYSHFWNWAPDWYLISEIYQKYPESYSILTPFAYSYLEELIRSTTSEYGIELLDNTGRPIKRRVGIGLINLAIEENSNNHDYITLLEKIKKYFILSTSTDMGDNRNSVSHGYMHPRFWNKESFEQLIHDIASISKYSGF